jgi:hypothetical protein
MRGNSEWWTYERLSWAAEKGCSSVILWIAVFLGLGILWIFVWPLFTTSQSDLYATFFILHQIILLILMTVIFTQIMARNVDLALKKQREDDEAKSL